MKYILFTILLVINIQLQAQNTVPLNDDCFHSFRLNNVIDANYQGIDFTNKNANESINNNCLRSYQGKTVWYNIPAISRFTRIIVEGKFGTNNLTLDNVALTIFSGDCNNLTELICTSPTASNIAEIILQTTPGTRYYIAVAG